MIIKALITTYFIVRYLLYTGKTMDSFHQQLAISAAEPLDSNSAHLNCCIFYWAQLAYQPITHYKNVESLLTALLSMKLANVHILCFLLLLQEVHCSENIKNALFNLKENFSIMVCTQKM